MDASLSKDVTQSKNIQLGCGMNHYNGWLNVDQYPTPATDMVFDLEAPWPLTDNCMVQAYSSHVVEHLPNWQTFFREAWRVLEPGGRLRVRVPYGMHPSAWWDFGHVRPWVTENFVFFQPGYAKQIGNPEHDDWPCPFGVNLVEVRLGWDAVRYLRRLPLRWLRQKFLEVIRHSAIAQEELFVTMTPLKSDEAVQQWRALNAPTALHINYVCWQHQWHGRGLREGELPSLHTLAHGIQFNGYN